MVAKPRKSDLEVDEEATMYSNSPWSSSAATDVLNLEKNEGRFFDDYLQLLFTGGWLVPSPSRDTGTC